MTTPWKVQTKKEWKHPKKKKMMMKMKTRFPGAHRKGKDLAGQKTEQHNAQNCSCQSNLHVDKLCSAPAPHTLLVPPLPKKKKKRRREKHGERRQGSLRNSFLPPQSVPTSRFRRAPKRSTFGRRGFEGIAWQSGRAFRRKGPRTAPSSLDTLQCNTNNALHGRAEEAEEETNNKANSGEPRVPCHLSCPKCYVLTFIRSPLVVVCCDSERTGLCGTACVEVDPIGHLAPLLRLPRLLRETSHAGFFFPLPRRGGSVEPQLTKARAAPTGFALCPSFSTL